MGPHEVLERLEVGLGLAVEMHQGEDGDLVAEQLLIEQRAIAFDVARLLERAHSPQAGRCRNPDPARELDIGNAAVVLQLFENPSVDGIETSSHETLRVSSASIISGVPRSTKDYCSTTVL